MSAPNIDGLFIAPDGDGRPCVWHERFPFAFAPTFVHAKPAAGFRLTPDRVLWNLLASILPERDA